MNPFFSKPLTALVATASASLLLWAQFAAAELPAPDLSANAPPPVSPILPTPFQGWTNAYRLANDHVQAVLVPSIGRLVHFGARDGDNVLRIDPELQGLTPPEGDPFFNVGGNWVWPVAQSRWSGLSDDGRKWPPPAPLADLPWTCSAWTDAEGAQCGLLSREYAAPLHAKVSRFFRLEPGSSTLAIRQRIERTAPSSVPVTLWTISQVAHADQIAVPVETDSRFPRGLKALIGRKPAKHLSRCGDVAVYSVAKGVETKLGSDSPRAWIAAAKGPAILFKSVANPPGDVYPDGGCVLELFSNEPYGYSEIETLSPEVDLPPGHVIENTLRMLISDMPLPAPPCSFADAVRQLAGE
jgi:hypothetical protein